MLGSHGVIHKEKPFTFRLYLLSLWNSNPTHHNKLMDDIPLPHPCIVFSFFNNLPKPPFLLQTKLQDVDARCCLHGHSVEFSQADI